MSFKDGEVVFMRARVDRVNHRGQIVLHPIGWELEYRDAHSVMTPGAISVDRECVVRSPIEQTAPKPVVPYGGVGVAKRSAKPKRKGTK